MDKDGNSYRQPKARLGNFAHDCTYARDRAARVPAAVEATLSLYPKPKGATIEEAQSWSVQFNHEFTRQMEKH
jgi:hypothetical protein